MNEKIESEDGEQISEEWTSTHRELDSGAIVHTDANGNEHYGFAYRGCATCAAMEEER